MKKTILMAAVAATVLAACSEKKNNNGDYAKYASVNIGTENTAYIDAISI